MIPLLNLNQSLCYFIVLSNNSLSRYPLTPSVHSSSVDRRTTYISYCYPFQRFLLRFVHRRNQGRLPGRILKTRKRFTSSRQSFPSCVILSSSHCIYRRSTLFFNSDSQRHLAGSLPFRIYIYRKSTEHISLSQKTDGLQL